MNKWARQSVNARCYLFSIYFVLQTNKIQTIYTLFSCSLPKVQNVYAVIITTFKDLLSKEAGLTGTHL